MRKTTWGFILTVGLILAATQVRADGTPFDHVSGSGSLHASGTAVRESLAYLHGVHAAVPFLLAGVSWELFLPYCTGAIVLIIGVSTGFRSTVSYPHLADKVISFGPVCLAVPMAVFGTEHFVFTESVTLLIPSWIPWHLFWVVLVGGSLVAGAISLAIRKYAGFAATLFGIMLLLFEVLIHIPKIAGAPGDRIAWAVALRDLAFAWGALSFAVTQTGERGFYRVHTVTSVARFVIGLSILFFGVEEFLHPESRPGVPLKQLTPLWIPAHLLWTYVTGLVFIITGLGLIWNKRARLAATWLGGTVLFLVLVIYVPVVIARPAAVGDGLNSLVDTLLLAGAALCLAGAQPKELEPNTGVSAAA